MQRLNSLSQIKQLMLVFLSVALAIMLGASLSKATLVAKWNFNNLNDSSTEDKENNKLKLEGDAKLEDGMLVLKNGGHAIVKFPDKSEILFEGEQEFTVWIRAKILSKSQGKESSVYFITCEGELAGWMLRPEDRDSLALRARGGGGGNQIFNVHGKTDNNDKYGDGKFHEYAFVRTKGEGFVWMDGEIDGTASTAGDLGTVIREYQIWVSRGVPTDGMVDELRLYNTALDDTALDAIEPDPAALDFTSKLTTTWSTLKTRYYDPV